MLRTKASVAHCWSYLVDAICGDSESMPGHSPGLLADAADPDFLMLLVGAAALADIELAVPAPAFGVDEEGEG